MHWKPFLTVFLCGCITDDSRLVPQLPDAATPDARTVDARPLPDAGPPTQLIRLTLDDLAFAVVGDTRPATEDDTAAYPTAVITRIFQQVQSESPWPPFVVVTGDYMFASTSLDEQSPQIDRWLGARSAYEGPVFPALGNHECTGATASNCGTGTLNGSQLNRITKNYDQFLRRMLGPAGLSKPWFEVRVDPPSRAWSAKLVFIAANAWVDEQADWLDTAMAEPTTYTFVVRHEGSYVDEAPGVLPSQAIIDSHPYTLLIVGHNHKYAREGQREVIIGNGGAPLNNSQYGYAIVTRRSDGNIQLSAYEYSQRRVLGSFALRPDGSTP